jgi:hypothetical protein
MKLEKEKRGERSREVGNFNVTTGKEGEGEDS